MKNSLGKYIYRFLFGLGMVSTLLIVVLFLDTFGLFGSPYKTVQTIEPTPIESGFELFDQKIERQNSKMLVTGKVKNTGGYDWRSVNLRLELISSSREENACSCSIRDFRAEETRVYRFVCKSNEKTENLTANVIVQNGFRN